MLTIIKLSNISSAGFPGIGNLYENDEMRDITALIEAANSCLPERKQKAGNQHVSKY